MFPFFGFPMTPLSGFGPGTQTGAKEASTGSAPDPLAAMMAPWMALMGGLPSMAGSNPWSATANDQTSATLSAFGFPMAGLVGMMPFGAGLAGPLTGSAMPSATFFSNPLAASFSPTNWMGGSMMGAALDQAFRSANQASEALVDAWTKSPGGPVSITVRNTDGPLAVFVGVMVAPKDALPSVEGPWTGPEGVTVEWPALSGAKD